MDATRHAAIRTQHPWHRRRLIAVPTIIAINVIVFVAWGLAGRNQAVAEWMSANFIVSSFHLVHGLWWTVLSSAFSHIELWHLALNMVVLWSFGSILERLWGVRVFVAFYLVAAAVSSLSHCLVSSLLLGNGQIGALGASGAVSGLLIAFALLFPRHKILVFAIIPVPALAGALFFVALDLWGLVAQGRGVPIPIGHGAHLGGALCGALFYLAFLRRRPDRADAASAHARRPSIELTAGEAAEFDRLRDKLGREGPGALDPEEREFLLRLRERALGTPGEDG